MMRSPIRSGWFDQKDCYVPCLPARQGIGWPFFPARTERYVRAGVTFFGHPKKVTKEKLQTKGKFDLIEML
jgi:hypothetical protein